MHDQLVLWPGPTVQDLPTGHVSVGLRGSQSGVSWFPGPREGHPDPITPGCVRGVHCANPKVLGKGQQSLSPGQSFGPSQVIGPVPPAPSPQTTNGGNLPFRFEQPCDAGQTTYAPLASVQPTCPATSVVPRHPPLVPVQPPGTHSASELHTPPYWANTHTPPQQVDIEFAKSQGVPFGVVGVQTHLPPEHPMKLAAQLLPQLPQLPTFV
jgi:hypothetical protein